jgi:arylsulfatase A-like enzyme
VSAAQPGGRNLVLITVDTLRIDLGFMGYSSPVSPHLDALAARSTVFERAYSMASYTGKSVGPMMIGKYASECARNGAHFDVYGPENTFLAERLHAAGFRTMGMAPHWYFKPKYGLTQGMDLWDLSAMGDGPNTPTYSLVTSDTLSDLAIGMLSEPANVQGRFFLWVHYFDPHQRYVPHSEAPSFARPGRNPAKALYDGEVWYTDHHLGRLLDFIAAQPWADRTVIVVTSDHGEAFGEHGMTGHGVDLWEPLVRVPLVVYVPGVPAHRVHVKRSLVDLVPTLLDLLELPQPPAGELSGRSTANAITDPAQADSEERDVYLDMPVGPQVHEHHAIIHGPTPGMKLLSEGGPVFFLFDLDKDAHEAKDLAGNRKLLAPMMKTFLEKKASVHEVRVVP